MPRNSQGVYSLPAGNPVATGTVITSTWANATMEDVAEQLNDTIIQNGSIPMTGPLTLAPNSTTQSAHAASKAYVDQFVAYSSGLPVGAVVAYASSIVPGGYLLCNGQAVSRTTYPDLFTAISTTFGPGDGVTTFNVPDLRDWFVRGKGANRAIGSTQQGSFAAHTHTVVDPGHDHDVSTVVGITNPAGLHNILARTLNGWLLPTTSNTTGISVGSTGGTETVPQNVAMDYYIKALVSSTNIPTPTIDPVPTAGSTNAVSSGGTFDALATKQDVLVNGVTIKTVNGEDLVGSGNVSIPAGPQGPEGPPGTGVQIVGTFGVSKTPNDLPSSGLIPANWDAPGSPAANVQMEIGQALEYLPTNTSDPQYQHLFNYAGTLYTAAGWTDVGNIQGPAGPAGPGVALGGATGQALVKTSGADYATAWGDVLTPAALASGVYPASVSSLEIGDWQITVSGTALRFAYNNVAVFSISSAGAVVASGNVTAGGVPLL